MSEQLVIPTLSGTFDALASGPDDGRPVLLLHGFPECAYQWKHQLAALGAAGFRGVAFDQRGYSPGIRPAEVDAYAPDELVGDVLRVAAALGWPRFDLVGHDWGSAVAWMVAAAHPDRLRSLTAVSTPHGAAFSAALRGDTDQQKRSEYFRLFRTPGDAERELLGWGRAAAVLRGPSSGPGRAVRQAVRRAGRADRGAQLVPRDAAAGEKRADHRAHAVRVEHGRSAKRLSTHGDRGLPTRCPAAP